MKSTSWVTFGSAESLLIGVRERPQESEIGQFQFCLAGSHLADVRYSQWLKLPALHVYSFLTNDGEPPSPTWYSADTEDIFEEVSYSCIFSDTEWIPKLGPNTKEYKLAAMRHSLEWHVVDCFQKGLFVGFTDNDYIYLLTARHTIDLDEHRTFQHRQFRIDKSLARDVAREFWEWFSHRWRELHGQNVKLVTNWLGLPV